MKFGVNTFIWSDRFDRSHLPLLARVKQAGFDGIEVPLFDPSAARDAEIKRALEAEQLACNFCAVLPPGLKTVAEMGGKLIAGPLYAPVGYLPGRRRTADEWKWAVECFQSLGPVLED